MSSTKQSLSAKKIAERLLTDPSQDLSDVGNTIGIQLAEIIKDKPGYTLRDFLFGLEHGLSLNSINFRIKLIQTK
jgi:hypothetical protein